MSDIWLIYSTFPSEKEAISTSRVLLENRLVACANVYDHVTSLYRWEGAIQQETEAVLMAKTQKKQLQAALDAIKKQHPYELPCIIAYPAGAGFPPFLQWVADETGGIKA